MQIYLNTSKWWQNLWAALIFFTRFPLWRIYQPPRKSYEAVVEFWPAVGWITGGIAAMTIYFGNCIFPHEIAVAVAIAARILATGALHEDGLADFIDGFGAGGRNKIRIMRIMKDSYIGTFGVLGLIFYVLLLFLALRAMPPSLAALCVFAADPYSKMIAGQLIIMLPYARNEEEAKAHLVYRKISISGGIAMFVQGCLPLAAFFLMYTGSLRYDLLIFVPCITFYFLYYLIWRKLRGYTGDCCGAVVLLTELSFYLTVTATATLQ